MARMLGRFTRPWCPYHRNKGFGLDCPDASKSKRQLKRSEEQQWRKEVSHVLSS